MANRFWVGGAGTWDSTSTANWSATSGGAAGASAPVAVDSVFFDANSGAGTCTTDATAVCDDMTMNSSALALVLGANLTVIDVTVFTLGSIDLAGFALTTRAFISNNANTRTLAFGIGKIEVTGNNVALWQTANVTDLTITGTPRVELTYGGGTGTRTIQGPITGVTEARLFNYYITAGTDTISLSGAGSVYGIIDYTGFSGIGRRNNSLSWNGSVTLSPTMTWELQTSGSLSLVGASGDRFLTTNGVQLTTTVNLNTTGATWKLGSDLGMGVYGFFVTAGTFDLDGWNVTSNSFSSTTTANARGLKLGASTWTVTALGAVWNVNSTNFTLDSGTSTIRITGNGTKAFGNGIGLAYNNIEIAGTGQIQFNNTGSFNRMFNSVDPVTVLFGSNATFTFADFDLNGTPSDPLTIGSTVSGTQFTLSQPSGVVSMSNTTITDSVATGGALWQAYLINDNVDGGNNVGWDFYPQTGRYIYTRRKNKRILL